jgi:hypothetical protein
MVPALKALRVAGLVALVCLFCFAPSAALAASSRPAADIAQSSAVSTGSGGSSSTTTTSTGSSEEIDLGFAALGFGFIALASVLFFVRRDRKQTLQVQQQLVTSGVPVQPQQVQAGAAGGVAPAALAAPQPPGPNQITIEGPDSLRVGQAVDFIARQQGNQAVAPWTAQPADILRLPAETTSRASITALKAGQVTLFAGAPPDRGVKQLLVSPASSAAPQGLPFIGAGWGTVVVAIAIMSVTAALGLAGALTGEAVATILGGLVGYVVAKSQSEPDSHKSGNQGGGQGGGAA